jgi:hypothetical protein
MLAAYPSARRLLLGPGRGRSRIPDVQLVPLVAALLHLSGGGLSATLPAGWQGHIALQRDQARLEAKGNDVSVRLEELGNAPGSEGFVPTRRVLLRHEDVADPARAARFGAPPHHALAARRLAVHGRSFLLVAELGRLDSGELLRRANARLAGVRISPPAGLAPAALRRLARPLRLPRLSRGARCPRSRSSRAAPAITYSLGRGPAYVNLGSPGGVALLGDDLRIGGLIAHKALWGVSPMYRGALLIRGRRLDGPGVVRFGPRRRTRSWWRGLWPEQRSRWRYGGSDTLLARAGCYAFQVDGASFSERIFFAAR